MQTLHPREMRTVYSSPDVDHRRIGRILLTVAHPYIAEMKQASAKELQLQAVDGVPLLNAELQTEALRLAYQRLFAALAHVHECGYAHNNVVSDNLWLRSDGTPLLSGFEYSTPITTPAAQRDVAALAAVLADHLGSTLTSLRSKAELAPQRPELIAELRNIATACKNGELNAVQARDALRAAARKRFSRRPRPARLLIPVAAFAIALLAGGGLATSVSGAQDKPTPVSAVTPTTLFEVQANGSRFTILADRADKVVNADLDCKGQRAVLLRASDNTMWVFDSLPEPGHSASASALRADVRPIDIFTDEVRNCQQLHAVRSDGTVERIQVGDRR